MSDQQFKKAAEVIQSLPKNAPVKVSQDTQLKVYALYKQATTGDVNTSRPGMLDMTGRYKWDAWNKLKGKSSEDAKKEYVQTFFEIFEPHKDDAEYAKYLEEVQSLA
ncbi:acyl-CoA-binding protein (ACBP)/diazepam binding inhibitor (DBI)/endozepine (EP) [Malassezia psittaci]|uniref:Acyl-CoA-binding protein (ACBP)/diazepam binding inhibitor (DBI)/endozepine (EP) n=1 Tax=Malassezia psittaci TaxID=1821823 RepID=A0AAF0F5Y7_9BASI|nr:acyl-CoA-binding protein (ACBP)/diazepam binding inhibitor (DBI)/endozepine (EP) [Malassezia psittaci]